MGEKYSHVKAHIRRKLPKNKEASSSKKFDKGLEKKAKKFDKNL